MPSSQEQALTSAEDNRWMWAAKASLKPPGHD